MLISVIIPCYNGSKYLPEAITSLRQQGMEIEIIVIDDGSTDGTAKIAKSLGCIVRTIPNSGAATARNTGLKLATGDFILFQDHDDLMKKGALANLLAPFRRDIFDIIGSFTESLITGETVDFLMRLKESGLPTIKIETITVARRLHSNNTGRTMKKQEHKDYASLLRRKLAARRS